MHPTTLRLAAVYNQPVPLGTLVRNARSNKEAADRDLIDVLAEEEAQRGSFERPIWRAHVLRMVNKARIARAVYEDVWGDFIAARDVLVANEQMMREGV